MQFKSILAATMVVLLSGIANAAPADMGVDPAKYGNSSPYCWEQCSDTEDPLCPHTFVCLTILQYSFAFACILSSSDIQFS